MGARQSHNAPYPDPPYLPPPYPQPLYTQPAYRRDSLDEEIEQIRKDLGAYEPGKTVQNPKNIDFPSQLFIGIFGRTGCGKTSLINSLRYATNGSLREGKWLQVAGQGMGGGHTLYRNCIGITKHVAVVDNRGVDEMHTKRAIDELIAQLAGARGYSKIVKWTEDSAEDSDEDDEEPFDVGDRISTAVFVMSATHDIRATLRGLGPLVSVLHANQGQYPVVVITHADVATPQDLKIVKAGLIAEGISESCIFTVANLTKGHKHLDKKYELTLLRLLDRCMTDGDRNMVFHHHKSFETERARERERKIMSYEAEIKAHLREKEILKLRNEQMEQEFIQRFKTAMANLKKERQEEMNDLKKANQKAIEKAVKDNSWCLLM